MIWYLYVCCRCSALVHHGGVGTTAAGLHCGKPTMVVPAFGDLFLFVDMCHQVRESSCIGCYITILLSACEQPAVCATAQTASVLRVASVLAAGLAPIVCCSAVCQNLSCHGSARVGVTHKLPRSVYLLLPVSQLPNAAGCGPAAIPLTELTAERLLAALQQLVAEQDRYSAAAAKVAAQLKDEDGLAAAVASVARTLAATEEGGCAADA
jgi:hypothetical protein